MYFFFFFFFCYSAGFSKVAGPPVFVLRFYPIPARGGSRFMKSWIAGLTFGRCIVIFLGGAVVWVFGRGEVIEAKWAEVGRIDLMVW